LRRWQEKQQQTWYARQVQPDYVWRCDSELRIPRIAMMVAMVTRYDGVDAPPEYRKRLKVQEEHMDQPFLQWPTGDNGQDDWSVP
jgi:hypothetical protein